MEVSLANLLSLFGLGDDEQQIDGWTGRGQEPQEVNPIASARRKASDLNSISNVGKGSKGEPGLIEQFIEDTKAGKGWRDGLNKKPTVSKQSSKTESKKQNQVETPAETLIPKTKSKDTPKAEEATAQDVFKDVTVPETQEGIAKSAEDKSMWSKALDMFDIGPKQAKELWDEVPNPLDRVDLLTTLTVYAASRYSGNNSGLALANGLMRGMESKAKQNQLAQMIEANQAEANQQKIDNTFKEREVRVAESNARTNLLNAQNKAKGGGDLLNKYSPEKVRDSVKETLTNLGTIKEGLIFGNSDKQNELILNRVENAVIEKIRMGDTRSPNEIATEEVKRLAAEQKK